jgi:hypothetical protein
MSQAAITAVMASTALLALGMLIAAVREGRAAGDLDAGTALTLSMGWLVSLPITIAVGSGAVTHRPDAFRELERVLPGWYEPVAHGSVAILGALAGVLILRRLTSTAIPLHTAGLLAIVLWTVAQLASALHGGPLLSLTGVVLFVCLVAATVLPRGRGACLGAGIFGVTLAIASGVVATLQYEYAFVPCRDACVLGPALTGALGNENLLGTALVAAIPFAYLGFRGWPRLGLVVYLAAMAIATGSRGAIATALVVVLVLLVVRPRLDGDRRTPARAWAAGLVLVAAVLASILIVVADSDRLTLTDRPELWAVASEYIQESPAFGYGPERWEALYTESGEIPRAAQHSTHNQWVDVLFAAGLVGTGLMVGLVAAAVWSAGHARPGVMLVLATVFLIGATERAWAIGALDFVSFSLVALILTGPARRAAGSHDPLAAGDAQPPAAGKR